jgi:hypothetical protein
LTAVDDRARLATSGRLAAVTAAGGEHRQDDRKDNPEREPKPALGDAETAVS